MLQVNMGGIRNKLEELGLLVHDTHADIITIQETKLTPKANTPKVHNFTTVRADRLHKAGGGFVALNGDNIAFATTDMPSAIDTRSTDIQMVTDDHRGQLITDVISNSDHMTLDTNTPAGVPGATLQQTSSPDITTVSDTMYSRTSWTARHALSSDHLPIITTVDIRNDCRLRQSQLTFTGCMKADWTQFAEHTESAFAQATIPTNIHTANIIFTNIILMADKHIIPKGKMHSNCRLLPDHIVCKITQGNNIRGANTCDPALKILSGEITSNIWKHKQNLWKEHLDAHWDHIHNTHIIWRVMHGLSGRAPPPTLNISMTFDNKIARQFANTVKHAAHRTNRSNGRTSHKVQGYGITLITTQIQEAIKQSKNNNSQCPDKLNIRHLKHIDPLDSHYSQAC